MITSSDDVLKVNQVVFDGIECFGHLLELLHFRPHVLDHNRWNDLNELKGFEKKVGESFKDSART
jgi:hypothetical protein